MVMSGSPFMCWWQRQVELCESEASLIYHVSYRTARGYLVRFCLFVHMLGFKRGQTRQGVDPKEEDSPFLASMTFYHAD